MPLFFVCALLFCRDAVRAPARFPLCAAVMKLMETHEGGAEDAGVKVTRDEPATVEPAVGSGGRF